MNDPITLATTQDEGRHGPPDTTVPDTPPAAGSPDAPDGPSTADALAALDESDAPHTESMRTLLATAATCRPVEDVTALVSLLKEDGRLPDAGNEALRTAAVTRPVQDVQRMVSLLGESPDEGAEADITLRAAAVGRSIEDVALLVSILGKDEPAEPQQRPRTAAPAGRGEPARPPAGAPAPERRQEPYGLPYTQLYDAPYQAPPRRPAPAAPEPAGGSALRHVLRWPVAVALLVSGVLHLPQDLTALRSAAAVDYLPLLVTVVCAGMGLLLALRDTAPVWRAGAATALGVAALHVLGGSVGFDPLAGTLGGAQGWAGAAVVLCAAAGAVLAGLALRTPREGSA
ncbi:hypothetical protein ACN6AT_02145 [Streptomyces sp. JL4002]|uniref:hypothetical protein n=1 Tax=Streptomyces TaxID=1883 RepID=UPI003B285E5F